MRVWQPKTIKIAILLVMLSAVGGCSLFGMEGTPQQMAMARAVHAFEDNRAPYSQRYLTARAYYKPRLFGLNPYFGR